MCGIFDGDAVFVCCCVILCCYVCSFNSVLCVSRVLVLCLCVLCVVFVQSLSL